MSLEPPGGRTPASATRAFTSYPDRPIINKKAGEMVDLRPRAGPKAIVRTTTHVKAGPAACVA